MSLPNTADRVLEVAFRELGKTDGSKYVAYFNKVAGMALPLSADWCCCFATYCYRESDVPILSVPNFKGCVPVRNWFSAHGRYMDRDSGYIPLRGDGVLYDWDVKNNNGVDHVGIVNKVQGGKIYTIEGNKGNKVQEDWWTIWAYPEIDGYFVPLFNWVPTEEQKELSYETFKKLMQQYDEEQAEKPTAKWAQTAMDFGVKNGIIVGDDKGLRPYSNVTRQEVMQMFYNALSKNSDNTAIPLWGKKLIDDLITGMTDLSSKLKIEE